MISRKDLGSSPGLDRVPSCVEFACLLLVIPPVSSHSPDTCTMSTRSERLTGLRHKTRLQSRYDHGWMVCVSLSNRGMLHAAFLNIKVVWSHFKDFIEREAEISNRGC